MYVQRVSNVPAAEASPSHPLFAPPALERQIQSPECEEEFTHSFRRAKTLKLRGGEERKNVKKIK